MQKQNNFLFGRTTFSKSQTIKKQNNFLLARCRAHEEKIYVAPRRSERTRTNASHAAITEAKRALAANRHPLAHRRTSIRRLVATEASNYLEGKLGEEKDAS